MNGGELWGQEEQHKNTQMGRHPPRKAETLSSQPYWTWNGNEAASPTEPPPRPRTEPGLQRRDKQKER